MAHVMHLSPCADINVPNWQVWDSSLRLYQPYPFVIGVSKKGIEEAIQAALTKAHNTLVRVSWFEVEEIHGHVGNDGMVTEYQVVLKVCFALK